MKVLGLVGILLVTVACNNAPPTATGYKEQLGAPAAVTANPGGSSGDATRGQTALAACTGCHVAGGVGHVLVAADATSLESGKAASNPAHGAGLAATFTASAKDIAAFLKGGAAGAAVTGDAVAGEALLKAQCETCHTPDGTGMGPALDGFAKVEGQDAKPIHASVLANFTDPKKKADIQAALTARPQ
ncbi:MAG TPA: c-type cytochrome [Oligoflexus sp.]|uniref:c-type cytochrome n=1 Tax=Oligoflexus sp. TaxID=1971216 RepID=UPI002D44BC53|nr:c-type cytochrome [Oligoflexus sp.]HYX34945.1 c-type cytochrome [Oligoflexus sp.]